MEKILRTDRRLTGIKKERLIVSQVRKWLPEYPMVMISGPRKVGKTTALLQLAMEQANIKYMDCSEEGAIEKLAATDWEDYEGTLLLDEFHHLPHVGDWMHMFNTLGEQNNKFRVVLTGSVSAFTLFMSQRKGGGRNKLLHLPLLTYLEYLHFAKDVAYDADLTQVATEDNFMDYMVLKGLRDFKMFRVDEQYIADAEEEIAIAQQTCSYTTSLLSSSSEDVRRALSILTYRLIDTSAIADLFGIPALCKRCGI